MSNAVKFSAEHGLLLLLTKLSWPSGLVRERACVQLAKLLLDPEHSEATLRHLFLWMKAQRLESVTALGLLPLLRARLDRSDFTLPRFEDLTSAVSRPSLLSALLLYQLSSNDAENLETSLRHSGDVPQDFSPHSFFGKYVKTFLPPYFDYLAGLIEEREVIAFRRHWAFEWQRLVDETGVKLTDRNLYFWFGSGSEKERVFATDIKLSEVYRSAFLRALAWAVSSDRLDASGAMVLAEETCPVNLDLWHVRPVQKPDWFTRAEESVGSIDTVPAQVWQQVEELWKMQRSDSSEWTVAQASGIVLDGTTIYDLEIYGMFQKSHGPREPSLEAVAEWAYGEVQLSAQFQEYLHYYGWIHQQRNKRWIKVFDDWSFAPAAGSLSASSFPRWQYWRMYRRIWLPTPYLGSTRLNFSCGDESVNVYENDELVAKWFDWVDGLTERHHPEVPMATGQCLQIRRKTVEDFSESTGSSYCWVCRLTGYHRKDSYGAYKQVRDHREFGCTRIATA